MAELRGEMNGELHSSQSVRRGRRMENLRKSQAQTKVIHDDQARPAPLSPPILVDLITLRWFFSAGVKGGPSSM